jgi:predicted ArsR family transcriptional regulator
LTIDLSSSFLRDRRDEPLDPDDLADVAALADPQRYNIYRFVVASAEPVSKDDTADAFGLARSVAAFHLDRLVAHGLLVPEYRRRSGRQGPGAGRPAKLYRRADREIAVSLPARRYSIAADLLATAVDSGEAAVGPALTGAARRRGRDLAAEVERRAGRRAGRRTLGDALLAVLEEQGYEPRRAKEEIILVNCPFHGLVDDHRDLVCGMNLDLLAGMVDALPAVNLAAHLEPSETACCVRLRGA